MSDSKIKVGIVSYLNSRPYLLGLQSDFIKSKIEMIETHPAQLVELFEAGKIGIALLPVGAILDFPEATSFCGYGIGASGSVKTVCLFAKVEVERIQRIIIDPESRTSVRLLEILMEKHFEQEVEWIEAAPGYEKEIQGTTAGLVIGDRAMDLYHKFQTTLDLAKEWEEMTGLGFVFARWLSRVPLDAEFVQLFEKALENGLDQRREILQKHRGYYLENMQFDLEDYLNRRIQYHINDNLEKGQAKFLDLLL